MSSTNKTTNYELSQFIETDKPGWLTDYNSDMRKLDTALKGVSDVASGASGGISSLADRMTAAEGTITTNTNDIDTLEARADALEAGAQSTAGTIANIQTEQTAQNMGIEAATELGYNLARPYDSASTYAVGAYVLFQNTLYKCITAVTVGEAFVPAKWLAIKATDEIAAGGYTLPIASASQLGGVKVGNGLSIDSETGLLSANVGGVSILSDNSVCSFGTLTSDSSFLTSPVMSHTTSGPGQGGYRVLINFGSYKFLLIRMKITVVTYTTTSGVNGYITIPVNWNDTPPHTATTGYDQSFSASLLTTTNGIRLSDMYYNLSNSSIIANFMATSAIPSTQSELLVSGIFSFV